MKVGRCTRAIDLVNKWDFQVEKRENSSEIEDNSRETLSKKDTDIELLTFSMESRNGNTAPSYECDSALGQDEEYK